MEEANTPQVFQGTRTEVTVPPSSRARDRFLDFSRIRRKASTYIRPGSRMEMYCSDVVALVRMAEAMVAVISPAALCAICRIFSTRARSMPVFSITPPKVMATMVSETVPIMASMPPRLKSSSTMALPLSSLKPSCSVLTAMSMWPPCTQTWQPQPMRMPAARAGRAGTLRAISTMTTTGTSSSQGVMTKLLSSTPSTSLILAASRWAPWNCMPIT